MPYRELSNKLKIRIYPKDYSIGLLDMTKKGIDDKRNGFYIIDVKEITHHNEDNFNKLDSINLKSTEPKIKPKKD